VERARARQVVPRELDFSVPSDTPRYWMGGDPYASHLMNVLSLTFPPGERFFMDAVRAFRSQLSDPQLLAQVRAFTTQEALHSREHRVMNDWLRRFGIDGDAIDRMIGEDIAARRATRTPLDDLAVTCALEHFTAIMAEGWLTRDSLREAADPRVRDLWTWHAIEELDHKSVAFDVYQQVSGDYARRVRWMLRITLGFIIGVSIMHVQMMAADKQFERPQQLWQVAKSWWSYWGPRGYFTRLIPAYLRYYRRDFHPWEKDDASLIARFEAELRGRIREVTRLSA
jgi:predicted metal-dependent hydrolase